MADYKTDYSNASMVYTRFDSHSSIRDAFRYYNSKMREIKFNDNWKKIMVNINDIVNRFTPNVKGKVKGVKYLFENKNYIVKADMASGYVRILDKKEKMYTKIDGSVSRNRDETHFKIIKRKDMNK